MPNINQNPEQRARDNIDKMLAAAGWAVQNSEMVDFECMDLVNLLENDRSKSSYNKKRPVTRTFYIADFWRILAPSEW